MHSQPASKVYALLGTSPAGLDLSEAAARLSRCGRNTISRSRLTPLYRKFFSNFTHLMALLLWAGGVIAMVARLPELAIAIWTVNVINGLFSFWQEYRADKATEALLLMLPLHALVMRAGTEMRIPAEELVPGDLMLLSEGDHISADARLVWESELRVDHSDRKSVV